MPIPIEELRPYLTDEAITNLENISNLPENFRVNLVVESNLREPCTQCGERYNRQAMRIFQDTDWYCDGCFDEDFFTCYDCDEVYMRDDCVERGGYLYCEGCAPANYRLMNYSAQPSRTQRVGPDGDRLVLGIEVELEMGDGDYADEIHEVQEELGEDFVLCEDGSLRHGFEIKSPPMSLQRHKEIWKGDFLQGKGFKGHGTTAGIHIHVDRESLTELQVAKICVFVNSLDNRSFMRTIAQRDSGTYTRFRDGKAFKVKYGKIETGDRYEAINIGGKATIEFRIFNSSTRMDRILKNLEFVRALCEYCEPSKFSLKSLNYKEFAKWMTGKSNRYPYLFSFMESKGILYPEGLKIEKTERSDESKELERKSRDAKVDDVPGPDGDFYTVPGFGHNGEELFQTTN